MRNVTEVPRSYPQGQNRREISRNTQMLGPSAARYLKKLQEKEITSAHPETTDRATEMRIQRARTSATRQGVRDNGY